MNATFKTDRIKLFVRIMAIVVVAFVAGWLPLHAASMGADENRYYHIVTIPIPGAITLEAGALQFMPNGQLAASTRLGDIYLIDNVFENPPAHVKFNRFANGLHEVLGLAYRDGWLYCTQRGEITRMKDVNGDGRADLFETSRIFHASCRKQFLQPIGPSWGTENKSLAV